jgi:hypothetical protein
MAMALMAVRMALRSPPRWQRIRSASTSDSSALSFIEKAKLLGANAILGGFTSRGGFDQAFADALRIESLAPGHVGLRLQVTPALLNSYGTLHGGATGQRGQWLQGPIGGDCGWPASRANGGLAHALGDSHAGGHRRHHRPAEPRRDQAWGEPCPHATARVP